MSKAGKRFGYDDEQARGRVPYVGFSFTEVIAVLALLGLLAAIIVPRVTGHRDEANRTACHTNRGDIELQAKLWRRNHGAYPNGNLTDIGADADYFPAGLPVCPVDGTAYTIDTTDGRVVGHAH